MKKFVLIGMIFCFSVFSLQVGFAADKEKGLVGYWKFDESSGTTAKDSSGKGNDGEVVGAEWVKGKIGNCLSFNGQDAYVEVAHNDELNPEKVTVSAWIKPEASSAADRGPIVVSKYSGPCFNGYLLLLEQSSGCPAFHVAAGPDMHDGEIVGDACKAIAAKAVTEGKWVHVLGTYDGKKANIYVNGVLVGSQEGIYTTEENGMLCIGAQSWNTQLGLFTGLIDEVKVYNRVLSADEIKALAAEGAGTATPAKK